MKKRATFWLSEETIIQVSALAQDSEGFLSLSGVVTLAVRELTRAAARDHRAFFTAPRKAACKAAMAGPGRSRTRSTRASRRGARR